MKRIILLLSALLFVLIGCTITQDKKSFDDKPKLESDTIRIANEELEYEVLIFDVGFSSWFNSFAKPRNYYSQSYLEARNIFWVLEWNRRAMQPMQYNPNLYEMTINYDSSTNYGYEVNYMLYNYLVYFQLTKNQKLGGFTPRI
ncbi:DUF6146 domain-containing protein [Flavobacterium cucumis]|uniref:Lipoprotein n=1 Tax=Flavobacterium cucumis TaxID=416016 RepID=A0A1M7ZXF6_9FLAO|nr:DUF6146 family protein [Flavobacterium cucumis]SHO73500.1 hypothetical protein SAMN05443547_1861 [Flavobacterium cucumis]